MISTTSRRCPACAEAPIVCFDYPSGHDIFVPSLILNVFEVFGTLDVEILAYYSTCLNIRAYLSRLHVGTSS